MARRAALQAAFLAASLSFSGLMAAPSVYASAETASGGKSAGTEAWEPLAVVRYKPDGAAPAEPWSPSILADDSVLSVGPASPTAEFYGDQVTISNPEEAVVKDQAAYARIQNVPLREAARRFALMDQTRAWAEKNADEEAFAGYKFDHGPDFSVDINVVGDSGRLSPLPRELDGQVEFTPAEFSLTELYTIAEELSLVEIPIVHEQWIDVDANTVVLGYVPEGTSLLDQGASLRDDAAPPPVVTELARRPGVRAKTIDSIAEPAALLYGGLYLGGNGCTSGFGVRSSVTGELGVSTAGHCGDTATRQGILLPYVYGLVANNQDIQWHRPASFDVTNLAYDGVGSARRITAVMPRSGMGTGDFMCKYGNVTHDGCGSITDIAVAPAYVSNARPTFIRANVQANNGDSGGPVYLGGTAWGTIAAKYRLVAAPDAPGDLLFMPIGYSGGINVQALTYSP